MGYGLDEIHIIGHGVGAHIAGYVGYSYNKIKKITGITKKLEVSYCEFG